MQLLKKGFLVAGFALLVLLHLALPRAALAARTLYDWRSLETASGGKDAPPSAPARALVGEMRVWRAELDALLTAAPYFGWVPHAGGDLAQAPHIARLADALLDAVGPSLDVYDAFEGNLQGDASFGGALLALADKNAGEIEAARRALERVKQARAQIDERDLSPGVHRMLSEADRATREWDAALELARQAPQLLGVDAPRRYLVLAQNNDELRATGGFISAVGVLKIERGEIGVEWFGDSFAADDLSLIHPPPPAPLEKYMWASQWLLRDANWYADFPASAHVAQSMYERDRKLATDGVIAVDVRFLPRLVGAMGDVELEGKSLEEANVISLLKASWKPMPPGDMSAAWFNSDRKNFLSELLNGMLARFRAGEVRSNTLAQALWRGLREKSVQVYLNDAEAEAALHEAGWSGAVDPGNGDYLFVADSNLGFNKVNAIVTREILYHVRLGEQDSDASVEITYNNPSHAAEGGCDLLKQHKDNTYASMEQSCYWNYVRVLSPRGSAFLSASGADDVGTIDENPLVTAFGGYAVIPRNTVGTVKFSYRLPRNILRDNRYTLKLQKQAGAADTPVMVRVDLPDGVSVRGATHPYVRRDRNGIEFQIELKQDTTLVIFLNP